MLFDLENQAVGYFHRLLETMSSLDAAIDRTAAAMDALLAESRELLSGSRVILYAKHKFPNGRPRRLYWGHLFNSSYRRRGGAVGRGSGVTWVKHWTSGIGTKVLYIQARRASKAKVFQAMDEKRTCLNMVSGGLAAVLVSIEASLRQIVRDNAIPPELESLPSGADVESLATIRRSTVLRAWRFCAHLAEIDSHLFHLPQLHNEDRPDQHLTLHYRQDPLTLSVQLPWLIANHGFHYGKLTDKFLRRLRVSCKHRTQILAVESTRRVLLRDRTALARVLARIRSIVPPKVASAHLALDRVSLPRFPEVA